MTLVANKYQLQDLSMKETCQHLYLTVSSHSSRIVVQQLTELTHSSAAYDPIGCLDQGVLFCTWEVFARRQKYFKVWHIMVEPLFD